jgi:hypothetical protein
MRQRVLGLTHKHTNLKPPRLFSCDSKPTVEDTDGNPPDRADEPPFDTALAGSIGIFGYISKFDDTLSY